LRIVKGKKAKVRRRKAGRKGKGAIAQIREKQNTASNTRGEDTGERDHGKGFGATSNRGGVHVNAF